MRILDFSDGFTSSSAPTGAGETVFEFTIANNQGVAANVTSMVVSSATYRGAQIEYDLYRNTDVNERRATGVLDLEYSFLTTTWRIRRDDQWNFGTPHGVTFSVTAGGQVQYTSDNLAGSSYASSLLWVFARRYEV